MNSCVLLYTKPAVPGRVKTRLIGTFTAEEAAALHSAFLGDVLEELRRGDFRTEIEWALSPESPTWPELHEARGLDSFEQCGDGLGERLFHGLRRTAARHEWVAAVGSDHPALTAERVQQAFQLLQQGAQVVFGPSEDGGYYLVGAHRDQLEPRLFEEIPWSTDGVLSSSLDRCRELGLEPTLLPEGWDVDVAEDIPRLTGYLEEHPSRCPRTREVLDRWNRL